MDNLKTLLKPVLEAYSGEAENGYSYLTSNPDETVFTIVSIGKYNGKHISFIDLIVRVLEDKIIIEEDRNSQAFFEALMQAGIPRKQIILAYAEEEVPALVF